MNKPRFKQADISFHHVADLYLAELRSGTATSVDTLITAFPHLESEIREQLPTLALLEKSIGRTPARKTAAFGDVFGGCRLIRELGRGAVGVVYEAAQEDIGRKVAIKIISLRDTNSAMTAERFELERKAMGRLEHPNIVPVFQYGHDSEYAYLVMKLILGHSLYDLQNGGGTYRTQFHMNELQSNWMALAELGRDVASGLHHAHQQGLVHRDIKPANLLLDEDGKCWISDFGLAKVYDYIRSISHTGDAIGTPRYMAPEQLRGVCDSRSDVYGLGITLYEIAAGEKVWGGLSAMSLVTNRGSLALTNIAELRPDLSPELCKIITKACQFAPDDRYQTADELRIVLDRLLSGATVGDRRKRKREPDEVFKRSYRKSTLLATTFATAVSFAVGLTYLELKRQNASQPIANDTLIFTPTASTTHSGIVLIDKLANENNDDMVEIVQDFVNESLGVSGDEMQFADPNKVEMKQQVGQLLATINDEGGLTKESLNKFLQNYRGTNLPSTTKVMRLTFMVQNARTMSRAEKDNAFKTLQELARAVTDGRMQPNEVSDLVDGLTQGQSNSVAEVSELRVADADLRAWLEVVRRRLSSLPNSDDNSEGVIRSQIKKAFEGASEKSSPTTR